MGLQRKLIGAGTGSHKYDLLTAMGLVGLHGSASQHTSMARLIVMVTARYNWARDEISIGQRDMARMWAVNERTAKREIKRLTESEVLICVRPGVRGRVAAYRLNFAEICELSRPAWQSVGPDFAARMEHLVPATTNLRVEAEERTAPVQMPVDATPRWAKVLLRLNTLDRAAFEAWFSKLELVCDATPQVHVKATSPFVGRYIETHLSKKLLTAFNAVYGPTANLRISTGAP